MTPKRLLGLSVFYLLLAVVVMWNPLRHAGQHYVPGNPNVTDYFHFHWSYWWIGHALAEPDLNVYETNYVLSPYSSNLAYHTMAPVFYPIWGAVEALSNSIWAMNAVVLAALTLTGLLMFLFLWREGAAPGLALLGGVTLQLSPPMLVAVFMTTIHYLGFFWLPAQMLLWGQVARNAQRPRRAFAWALLQGLALYAMLMTDYQYFLYGLFTIVPYGLLTLWAAGRRPEGRAALLTLIGAGLLALALMLILGWLAGPLPALLEFDRAALAPGPAELAHGIEGLRGFVSRSPTPQNTLSLGAFFVPFLLLLLALALLWRLRLGRAWLWLGLALLLLILAAGASVTLAGVEVPLPYRGLHRALGSLYRSPGRFGVAAIVPAFLFIAAVWQRRPRHYSRRYLRRLHLLLIPLLLWAALAEARIFQPLPVQPAPLNLPIYEQMAAEPYDYVVLEVPVAAGTGESWVGELPQLALQYHGLTHHKRMINGLIARAPVAHFWYLRTDHPTLSWLGQRRLLEPATVQAQLASMIEDYPIGYIVVHPALLGGEPSTEQEIIGFLNQQDALLCPPLVDSGMVAYRTRWHPAGCSSSRIPPQLAPGIYQLDIGTASDNRFLGWGWHWREEVAGLTLRWTGDWSQLVAGSAAWLPPATPPQAALYLDLPPAAYRVRMVAQAYETPQSLTLLVNGESVGSQTLSPDGLAETLFEIPAALIGDGQHLELILQNSSTAPTPDGREVSIIVDLLQFEALP